MQTLPLLPKLVDIAAITKAASAFIWRSKRPCMAFCTLYLPKRKGEVGLLDLRIYTLSCLLRQGLDWLSNGLIYSNYILEATHVSPYSQFVVLHSTLRAWPTHLRSILLIRDTMIAWREICKNLKVLHFPLSP